MINMELNYIKRYMNQFMINIFLLNIYLMKKETKNLKER